MKKLIILLLCFIFPLSSTFALMVVDNPVEAANQVLQLIDSGDQITAMLRGLDETARKAKTIYKGFKELVQDKDGNVFEKIASGLELGAGTLSATNTFLSDVLQHDEAESALDSMAGILDQVSGITSANKNAFGESSTWDSNWQLALPSRGDIRRAEGNVETIARKVKENQKKTQKELDEQEKKLIEAEQEFSEGAKSSEDIATNETYMNQYLAFLNAKQSLENSRASISQYNAMFDEKYNETMEALKNKEFLIVANDKLDEENKNLVSDLQKINSLGLVKFENL